MRWLPRWSAPTLEQQKPIFVYEASSNRIEIVWVAIGNQLLLVFNASDNESAYTLAVQMYKIDCFALTSHEQVYVYLTETFYLQMWSQSLREPEGTVRHLMNTEFGDVHPCLRTMTQSTPRTLISSVCRHIDTSTLELAKNCSYHPWMMCIDGIHHWVTYSVEYYTNRIHLPLTFEWRYPWTRFNLWHHIYKFEVYCDTSTFPSPTSKGLNILKSYTMDQKVRTSLLLMSSSILVYSCLFPKYLY